MPSNFSFLTLPVLALALFSFFVQSTRGEITCEHLDEDTCAYAVSSAGKRCVLEKHVKRSGEEDYTCRTSEIVADMIKNRIETDQCIKSCGLDRKSFGISSDSLLESRFTEMLCSSQCYNSCPNIVDLYFNLAAGEGVFLPKLCEAQGANTRRGMSERQSGTVKWGQILSSGQVASGPTSGVKFLGVAPAMPPLSTLVD